MNAVNLQNASLYTRARVRLCFDENHLDFLKEYNQQQLMNVTERNFLILSCNLLKLQNYVRKIFFLLSSIHAHCSLQRR